MIPLFKVRMSEHALAAVSRVFSSGHIAQGPVVDQFEAALAKELGCSPGHVVTVNSGTSAIHLGLVLAGVGPGDTVAVSPMTCAASIVPILHLGAHPLWIDVDPETYAVHADGELLTCEPAVVLPMAQRYFLF